MRLSCQMNSEIIYFKKNWNFCYPPVLKHIWTKTFGWHFQRRKIRINYCKRSLPWKIIHSSLYQRSSILLNNRWKGDGCPSPMVTGNFMISVSSFLSNIWKRLFLIAWFALTSSRKCIITIRLDSQIFFHINNVFWGVEDIDIIMREKSVSEKNWLNNIPACYLELVILFCFIFLFFKKIEYFENIY